MDAGQFRRARGSPCFGVQGGAHPWIWCAEAMGGFSPGCFLGIYFGVLPRKGDPSTPKCIPKGHPSGKPPWPGLLKWVHATSEKWPWTPPFTLLVPSSPGQHELRVVRPPAPAPPNPRCFVRRLCSFPALLCTRTLVHAARGTWLLGFRLARRGWPRRARLCTKPLSASCVP